MSVEDKVGQILWTARNIAVVPPSLIIMGLDSTVGQDSNTPTLARVILDVAAQRVSLDPSVQYFLDKHRLWGAFPHLRHSPDT